MSTCDTHVTESGTLAFRVALSVLRHREDAEDVAQEAVVRSLQRFNSLRDRTRFRAWLVRIAWRLALDRRRSDTRRAARDLRMAKGDSAQVSAEQHLIVRERADRLWAAIDELPPRLRLPLVLGTVQGHGLDDVASLLGVPVGTVKSRTFEARRRLKRALIGTGVFVSLTCLALSITPAHRLPAPETVSAGLTLTHSAPEIVASAPTLTTSDEIQHQSRPDNSDTPGDAAPESVLTTAAIQIPIVKVPVVAPTTLEVQVVPVPVIQLPVVAVLKVDVPIVKTAQVGISETHQERRP